jgi:DNA-directed RNA polymerase subunit RPC12/RpoP
MMKYAGGATCPRCRTSLVHEYDCAGDCLPQAALTEAEQRLRCPRCDYTRGVAYVIDRRQLSNR